MGKINYIVHLNTVLERFDDDQRIRQGHIALYMALFRKWNRSFFKEVFSINRSEIMDKARFKSKTTYHNHIRDLDDWGYLEYQPSYSPRHGSKINMYRCGTSTEQVPNCSLPESGQERPETRPKIGTFNKTKNKKKLNKRAVSIFNEKEVISFFNKNNWPEIEALKFHSYIKSKKWKTDNWRMIATIFAKNDFKLKEPERASPFSGYVDNLQKYDYRDKDYGVPL